MSSLIFHQDRSEFVPAAERGPLLFPLVAALLMGLGLFSVSYGDRLFGGALAERQLFWCGLAIGSFWVTARCSYRRLIPIAAPLFLVTIVLLVVVFFMPRINGSRRWIPLGPLNFQPSEVAKLTFVLALASYLRNRSNYRRFFGLAFPFAMTFVPVVLILKEPDLGTSLLFLPTLGAMLFTAGARLRHLIVIGLLGVCALPPLWMTMSAEQKSRITVLFTPHDRSTAPQGDGYHLWRSKETLRTGGLWGVSQSSGGETAEDDEKNTSTTLHLPAARTDFVFCLIGHRFGLLGCGLTLLLEVFVIGFCFRIGGRVREPFGRLVAVGIGTLLGTQLVINTGMTVGLMPITGMTLPLVSYGGSSLISTATALGLVFAIARQPAYTLGRDPFVR